MDELRIDSSDFYPRSGTKSSHQDEKEFRIASAGMNLGSGGLALIQNRVEAAFLPRRPVSVPVS